MKTKIFIPLVCSAVFSTGVMAKCAAPACESGSTCNNKNWDTDQCGFVCDTGTCKCGTKTYTCLTSGGGLVTPKCDAGEYGNGLICNLCPESGTSAVGTTTVQGCYLPKGTVSSDSTGTYTYTADCYHD